MIRKPTITVRANPESKKQTSDERDDASRLFERGSRSRWIANWMLAFTLVGGAAGSLVWGVNSAGDDAETELSRTRRTVAASTDELGASLEGVEDLNPELVAKIIKFIDCDLPEIRLAVGLETDEPDCEDGDVEATEEAREEEAVATTIPG